VSGIIKQHFEPVSVNVIKQSDLYQKMAGRFDVNWTPTVLVLDADGKERHRLAGYLPPPSFASQLLLGLGQAAFAAHKFDEAEKHFRQAADTYPNTPEAPEAVYWAGVSKYKATGDAAALKATAQRFSDMYQDSTWATKASVWK
jgi:tetratricopeptide (TPR) repeat protein